MRRPPRKGNIRPKVSTMPRQKSEAAAFLDIYKLVVEKKRLQEELNTLDQRRQQICDRLAVLDSQVSLLEGSVQQMREASPEAPLSPVRRPAAYTHSNDTFETIFLEY